MYYHDIPITSPWHPYLPQSKAPPGAAAPSPAANFAASPAGRYPSRGRAGPRGARTLGSHPAAGFLEHQNAGLKIF